MQNKEQKKEDTIKLTGMDQGIIYKQWYTLQEACLVKGLNIKTAYNKRYLMPNSGIYDGAIGGRKCFSRETILKWLGLTDKDIINEY